AEAGFARTVVAAPPVHVAEFERIVGPHVRVVAGGETRSASVRKGVEALAPADEDIIAVHDAARPLVTPAEIAAVVGAGERGGAAIAVTPVVDTIKRIEGDLAVATVDRSTLIAAATPQAFRGKLLRQALAGSGDATDEAAQCEALGIPVTVVPVSRLAFKITN